MGVELLAPAGSVEALRAAFLAGADAVYIGGDRFGARAYADNPGEEELLDALALAHRLDKKVYLTVNTLLKDAELEEELAGWIRPYVQEGLDAAIVQDLGVADLLRERFPELPLHASTQMAVTGPEGAKLLEDMGFRRLIPARELSLTELKRIAEATSLELETFVHGAMCYSYSGECLMSSLIGGRSGNRGRCAGVCRLPFRVEGLPGKRGERDGAYPLNMKDLCALDLLPELIGAGITSFKIEGRMKKPEYTAGVVDVYRRVLDAVLSDRRRSAVRDEDRRTLLALYNRDGFTEGYYSKRNGPDMIAVRNEKLQGTRSAEAQRVTDRVRQELREKEKRGGLQKEVRGEVRLRLGQPAVCTLRTECAGKGGREAVSVTVTGAELQQAKDRPLTEEQVLSRMRKTGGSPFRFGELSVQMDDGIFAPVQVLNQLRRDAFAALDGAVREHFRRHTDEWPARLPAEENGCTGGPEDGLRLRALPRTEEQLRVLLREEELDGICLPLSLRGGRETVRKAGKQAILALPYILRMDDTDAWPAVCSALEEDWDGVLVRCLEEVGLLRGRRSEGRKVPEEIILDTTVPVMNGRAARVLGEWGFPVRTLSLEMSFAELRRQQTRGSEIVLYGRAPMMISAQCLRRTFGLCGRQEKLSLRDRRNALFPADCDCITCTSVIANSVPTSLLRERQAVRELQAAYGRLDFTRETEEETEAVLKTFVDVFRRGGDAPAAEDGTTRGHFRRGVE